MPARSESLGQDLKAWAADQLRVDVSSPPEAVRAAYLRQVQHDNGGPNLTAREALLILTGRSGTARPALALEAAEEKLQREVDDFADRFFKLSIAERKAEWERLRACGQGFVRIDARLTALRRGLYIVVPHLDPELPLGQLVALVCELFVLRPAARAAQRHARLLDVHRRQKGLAWASAAELLRNNHAAIAALEPELVAKLADADARKAHRRDLNQKMRKKAAAQPVAGGRTNSYWWVLMLLMFGGALLRGLSTTSSSSSTSRFTPQQPLVRPNGDQLENFNKIINEKFNKVREWQKNNPGADPKDMPRDLLLWETQKEKATDKRDAP